MTVAGITHTTVSDAAMAFGAAMLSFNFCQHEASSISPEQAARIPSCLVKRVGVFGTQSVGDIVSTMQVARLDFAQVSEEKAAELLEVLGAAALMVELHVHPGESLQQLQQRIDGWEPHCAMIVLKVSACSLPLLPELRFCGPWMLSAPLNASQLAEVMQSSHPSGIELDATVETAPGIKNLALLLETVTLIQRHALSVAQAIDEFQNRATA